MAWIRPSRREPSVKEGNQVLRPGEAVLPLQPALNRAGFRATGVLEPGPRPTHWLGGYGLNRGSELVAIGDGAFLAVAL